MNVGTILGTFKLAPEIHNLVVKSNLKATEQNLEKRKTKKKRVDGGGDAFHVSLKTLC